MNKSTATYRENQSAPALAFGAIVSDKVKAAQLHPAPPREALIATRDSNSNRFRLLALSSCGEGKKARPRIEAIAAELIPAKAKIHKATDHRLNWSMPWVSRPHPLKGVQAPRDICPYVDNTNSDLGYTEGNPVGTRYSAGQVNTAGSLDGSSARRASSTSTLRATAYDLEATMNDDLRYPPTADSTTRRLAAIDAVLAKVTGE